MDNLINKILQYKNGDKILHFLGGAIISGLVILAGYPIYAGLAAGIVGAGKEVYDYFHPDKHQADIYDFLATLAGGVLVSAGYYVV